MTESEVITRDREILGGIPVFAGTRVPIKNLLDYLSADHSLDEFLDDFPSVQKSQAQKTLTLIGETFRERAA